MNIKNTETSYGIVSKLLHWLLAIAIITMIPLGWYLTQLNNESVRYWRLLELHETVGLLVFILFFFKFTWKFISPNPVYLASLARWERILAHLVHSLFLLAFALIPFSGYIFIASGNDPIELYKLIVLPALDPVTKSTSSLLYDIHFYSAYACGALVVLHIIAVLKHHFMDKNSILRRMTY